MPVCTMCGDGGTLGESGGVMVRSHSKELDEGKGEGPWVSDSGALCCIRRAAHGKEGQGANDNRCLSVLPYFGECVYC